MARLHLLESVINSDWMQWLSESLSGEESQRVKSDRLVDDESRFYQLRTPFGSVEMHRHIETLMPESSFSDSS